MQPLDVTIYQDATLLPAVQYYAYCYAPTFICGGYAQGKPIPEVHFYKKMDEASSVQAPPCRAEIFLDRECIFGGKLFTGYGHFLLESLAMAWYIKQFPDLPIVWDWARSPEENRILRYQQEILSLVGIPNEHIVITKPTLIKTLHVPTPGFILNSWGSDLQLETLGVYSATPEKGRFVYLSRAGISGRGCVDELELEVRLQERGWEIVRPETMPLREQLQAIATAEVCFTVAGSALHALMLMKNLKTKFIVIPRIHDGPYTFLANKKSDSYFVLNMEKKVVKKGISYVASTFTIDVEKLMRFIEITENFQKNLEALKGYLSRPERLTAEQTGPPPNLHQTDCTVRLAEKLFYYAMRNRWEGNTEKAVKQVQYLQKHQLINSHMKLRCAELVPLDS